MSFLEAFQLMKQGRHVKRRGWYPNESWHLSGNIISSYMNGEWLSIATVTTYDIDAQDWEVIK